MRSQATNADRARSPGPIRLEIRIPFPEDLSEEDRPMESLAPVTAAAEMPAVRPQERAAAWPWTLTAMLAGSTSIIVGLLWDISWHMTIGRDTSWTPAHMAIYLGAVLAGMSYGAPPVRTTCRGSAAEQATGVRFR